ncbi:UDP-N-acetylglucosamine 2-epimerase (non-hydrolyzing) [Nocardioides sp. cx-169]|uniref:non-hydrolyzing UDP-N-acetylglucosamine 2-epimerase n=1 Tax=Nocardioides sp. cx-169 TaxID=2899080 RepID=UPI001E6050C0|nr:UDP-N-acetylglucosamine 2-epimerase (non-hydrolyzing) [Nocardioides sp. cx-169]MCD4533746.1 UDP-N-acetylglucosamine 2-epimerase (non-hydrolyzing) [Nocardioides sp. cx-169]
MKVMTVVGTRPEIIRLSAVIARLDQFFDQVLVHTGQNFDYELSEVFFEELGVRRPDSFLGAAGGRLGTTLGSIFVGIENLIAIHKPDVFLILGDTNSCLSALIAKRLQVPVYHMEAGNRSFDENVPEEINRRAIDHISDFNLVYTEHARRNLLAEGLPPRRIQLTGSPMAEVLRLQRPGIDGSTILSDLSLERGSYFLASLHRQENVDNRARLTSLLRGLSAVAEEYDRPVLVSTHPRTRARLEGGEAHHVGLQFHKPWGFNDYSRLQLDAACVLSDSGSVSEEAAILGFPAVTVRDAIERPEALDAGSILMSGTDPANLIRCVALALDPGQRRDIPAEYEIDNCSSRTVAFIASTFHRHAEWAGLRPLSN